MAEPQPISFARGVPPPEALPVDELADCARAAIAGDGARVLNYGPVGGYPPLREWVAERYGVDSSRVLLTNGSLQAFVLLADQLAGGGRRVLLEAPTYDRPLKILARIGAEAVAVPQNDHGLDLDALERALDAAPAPPAFLYTIPTFQNPSGRTLPTEGRRRLVELARAHGLLILEDDPYGLVRFEGEPPPTLFELAQGDGVIFMSSFSKIVSPGLRVAFAILPPDLVAPVEERATQTYLTPVLTSQATAYEFVRRGNLEPNLERVCALLRERRDTMLQALEHSLPDDTRWSRPEGGYFLWLDLPPGIDAGALLDDATRRGVTFVKGSDFFPGGSGGRGSARLAYSFASPREIPEGVELLAAALRAAQPLTVPVQL